MGFLNGQDPMLNGQIQVQWLYLHLLSTVNMMEFTVESFLLRSAAYVVRYNNNERSKW